MNPRANKLRNFASGALKAYAVVVVGFAFLVGMWSGGRANHPSDSLPVLWLTASNLLWIGGLLAGMVGIYIAPRRSLRPGRSTKGRGIVISDPDDPYRVVRWGVVAGLALALFVLTVVGIPFVHWLNARGVALR